MSYSAEISRTNPTCFLFLIDRSGSMDDPFGGDAAGRKKSAAVADGVNKLLQTLAIRCAKEEGVRDYFHVGVLGYGDNKVGPAFSGALAGRDLVPISEVANTPARVEERTKKVDDGAGGLVETKVRFPVWFDAVGVGSTPMCGAMAKARVIVQNFLAAHPACFPPVVINITDGESNDGDPSGLADELKALSVADGNVLVFNAHLSSSKTPSILYPDAEGALPDAFAKTLFRMSSELTGAMQQAAQAEGFRVSQRSRGFVFNAELADVVRFIDIGTRVASLR